MNFDELDARQFMWEVWYACDYRCSYCPWEMSGSWDRMASVHKAVRPEEWIAAWERVHRNYGAAHLSLIGGEPLLYPRMDEILRELSAIHYLSVITNLSLSLDRVKKMRGELRRDRVRFGASFHPEFSDLDRFSEKLSSLQDDGFSVWASIVAWPPLLGRVVEYKDALERRGIPTVLQSFFGSHLGKTYPLCYTPEEKAVIAPHIPEILKPYGLEQQPTLGKPCGSGYIYSKVIGNGDVYRCGSLVDYGRPAPMGNLMHADFRLWTEPTPCPRRTCDCGESKFLWENYAPSRRG